jgi:hypothetical protein
VLAALTVVCAYSAATAMAQRTPNMHETRVLLAAFDKGIHRRLPSACFTYTVSTIRPTWAVLKPTWTLPGVTTTLKKRPPLVCAKFAKGGYLLHRARGQWSLWAGTSATTGGYTRRGHCIPVSKKTSHGRKVVMPLKVAKDLKLC